MNFKRLTMTSLASLALALTLATTVPAQEDHTMMEDAPAPTGQFQRIDQPLGARVAVTIVGFGLIGLDLWWFVLSKPKGSGAL